MRARGGAEGARAGAGAGVGGAEGATCEVGLPEVMAMQFRTHGDTESAAQMERANEKFRGLAPTD